MYKYTVVLFFLLLTSVNSFLAQNITVFKTDSGVCFTEGNDTILFYQTKEKTLDGSVVKSNYIHPLYDLNGQVITEDSPVDHPHHRGLFWAWHQLYIGDKRIGDGWELKDIHMDVDSVYSKKNEDEAQQIVSKIFWKSPLWISKSGEEIPLVEENTKITVYPRKKNYRLVDLSISLIALEDNMKIGGAENPKGYGGFSYRIKLAKDTRFLSSTGDVEPMNLPVKAGPWMDVSGSIGKGNSKVGFTVICHPKNPNPINQWILRKSRSMQNAVYPYPGAEAVPLSKIQPTLLKYRLVIHSGDIEDIDISYIYKNFIK